MSVDHGEILVGAENVLEMIAKLRRSKIVSFDAETARIGEVLKPMRQKLGLGIARGVFLGTLERRGDQLRPQPHPYRGDHLQYVRQLEREASHWKELCHVNRVNQDKALKQCGRSVAQAEHRMRVCFVLGLLAFFMWVITMILVIVAPP